MHVWHDGGDAAAGDASAVCAARSGPGREGGVVRGYVREGVHPCHVRGRGCVDAGDGGHRGEGTDHPERAVQTGLSERVQKDGARRGRRNREVRVRPSLLPADYTPMSNLLAGWYYCAYEPCDVGSEAYEAMDEAEREADSEYGRGAGRCTSAAFTAALDTLVEKLGVLEEHLERHAYCCGERMGVDDVMRFVVLQILFVNLGELWGLRTRLAAEPAR